MKSFLLHCLFAAAGTSACLAATYPLASQQNRAGAVNDPGTVLLSTGDGSGFAAIDDTFSGQVVVTATIQFDSFGGANAHAGLELVDGANPRLALGNGAGSSNWGGSAASTSFDIPGAIPVATGSPRTLSLVIDYVAGADDHATVRIDGSGATGDFTFTGDCSFGEVRVRNADCVVDFTKLSVVVIRAPQPGAANPALAFLEAGEIEPQGWIKEQMRLDLEDGYYPHYPAINSTVTHELFVHQDRFSRQGYNGLADWWSGEHEGYWKDGLLRMAFLAGDAAQKASATAFLDAIVAAQGPSGYIGIYADGTALNTRYNHSGENGELWTQSRIFQALIAGYEFTGDTRYFYAVARAAELTIARDPGNYFTQANAGGVSHGVGFFDTLWFLHQRTGDPTYSDFAVKLYNDFSTGNPRDYDLKLPNLLGDAKFQTHGAHVAEAMFVPGYIASLTTDPAIDLAAERAMTKLKYHLAPGGAMVCAESISGQPGAGSRGYEYCGIAQQVQSLNKITAITGDPEASELAERMTLNAGQGARFPVLSAVAYVAHDNQRKALESTAGQREAYGAFHSAAACCSLNAGRLMPYYVEGMWMKSAQGLTAQLYGPCRVETSLNGTTVEIIEETTYPFSDAIAFTVNPQAPTAFRLAFRIPSNASAANVTGVAGAVESDGYLVIDRTWQAGDSFTLEFTFPVERVEQVAGSEYYLRRGPLVYSIALPEQQTVANVGTIPVESGFHIYNIEATDSTAWSYRFPEDGDGSAFSLESAPDGDPLHPFASPPLKLTGPMLDGDGDPVSVEMVPLGSTRMRRTTFPTRTEAPLIYGPTFETALPDALDNTAFGGATQFSRTILREADLPTACDDSFDGQFFFSYTMKFDAYATNTNNFSGFNFVNNNVLGLGLGNRWTSYNWGRYTEDVRFLDAAGDEIPIVPGVEMTMEGVIEFQPGAPDLMRLRFNGVDQTPFSGDFSFDEIRIRQGNNNVHTQFDVTGISVALRFRSVDFASFIVNAGVPAGQRGEGDDPDGDGWASLLEFLYGTHPAQAGSKPPGWNKGLAAMSGADINLEAPGAGLEEGKEYFVFEVSTPADQRGLTVEPEGSATLAGFSTTAVRPIGAPTVDGDQQIQKFYLATPIQDAGAGFIRLRVTE